MYPVTMEPDDGNLFVSDCTYYNCNSFNIGAGISSPNSLMILHHNIRSFSRNFDELAVFLDGLNRRFHVIILTETWFSANNTAVIDNYTGYHVFRTTRLGGGVSVYVINSLKGEHLTDFSFIGESYEVCTVKLVIGSDRIHIMGVYRPPNDADFEYHLDNFLLLLGELCKQDRKVFIAGDFNVDTSDDSARSRLFDDAMRSIFLMPLITVPTRINNDSQTLLDNIWTNQLAISMSGVFVVDVTDHFPIFVVAYHSIESNYIFKHFRDHSPQSLYELKSSVRSYVLNYNIRNRDFDAELTGFMEDLMRIYDDCCAIRAKRISVKSIAKPWVDGNLRNLIRRKHYLFGQFKSGGCSFVFYNDFKNMVSKQLKSAKRQFYRKKLNDTKSSTDMWKILRKLLNGKDKSSNIVLDIDGSTVSDSFEVASTFNSYFSNVADQIERNIPNSNRDPMSFMTAFETCRSFFAVPSTPQEVHCIVTSLKLKGAPLTDIPAFIFRELSEHLCPLISAFFNKSLTAGIFPDALKCARIVPIHKAGDKKIVSNYRPISTLCILSKIFEILMCKRMKGYIEQFSLLSKSQFGFRQNCSTVDAIAQFLDSVCDAIDHREYLVSVFIDFQKAFDTVDHGILIRKLHALGFRGPVSDWLRSYLSNRKQCVSVDGSRSQLLNINRGVPQGSILGPLLFNLYINDMHAATGLNILHYADDTTVFLSGIDVQRVVNDVNKELDKIDVWLCANRLSLNVAKSKVIVFTKKNLEMVPPIKCRGALLDFVESFKFLGITLDVRLSFMNHGFNVISRLSRSLGVMRKLSFTLPVKAMLTLYYSMFYCHLSYAIVVWGNASVTVAGRIANLQRQAVKLLDRNNDVVTNFDRFRILKFSDVVKYFCVQKFYRTMCEGDSYFSHKVRLAQVDHRYETRFVERGSVVNVYCRTECSIRSFLPQAIKYWNELPDEIKSAATCQRLKVVLRQFYLRLSRS